MRNSPDQRAEKLHMTGALSANMHNIIRWSLEAHRDIVPYFLASVVALGLDFAVYMMLASGHTIPPSIAGVVGYSTGSVIQYWLSSRYVFDISIIGKSEQRLLIEFFVSGFIGVAITWGTLAVSIDWFHFGLVIANGIAVIASFSSVYLVRKWLVFR